MDISKHVETMRGGITNAASLADEGTQDVARRLGTAVDSSARLALLGAISEAAGEISAELAPGSVEVRVVEGNPNFAVHLPQPTGQPRLLVPEQQEDEAEDEAEETDEDQPMVRVSLRLPASVKRRVDVAADDDGISTNAWLVKTIQNALSSSRLDRRIEEQVTGAIFGPNGPFGDNGPFGSAGVFGERRGREPRAPRAPRPPRPPRPPRTRGNDDGGTNQVKGWAR